MQPDDSLQLIESLRQPEAYDHPVGPISVVETHISWVVLTGSYAYKLKKPVNLGFVDFSTLDRRLHFCREELRLNGRLAPDLYLDVVPITGTPQKPRVAGSGIPIEYAVRMRQFPQEALLGQVLARGELTNAHIDQLTADVAAFHSCVAVAGSDTPFGTPERLREPVDETVRFLDSTIQTADFQQKLDRLCDWIEIAFSAHRADFEQRKQEGFVRECHGDMHLGNMILEQGRVVIFDCIEFNDNLRWIDVASEIAFCVMDLEDRKAPRLARRFLNAYLERTGDYAALRVISYYFVYRALVRAKVAAIRLGQDDLLADERSRLVDECRQYLELAEASTRPLPRFLAITHGFSGSGKTFVAQSLLEQTAALRVRSDVERKRLFEFDPLARTSSGLGESIYAADATQRTYARLLELASLVLNAGFPVIVDATFLMRAQREQFRRLAKSLNVRFLILDCRADDDTLNQRVQIRAREEFDASEADLAVLERQRAIAEPLGDDERADVIAIDTDRRGAATQLCDDVKRILARQAGSIRP